MPHDPPSLGLHAKHVWERRTQPHVVITSVLDWPQKMLSVCLWHPHVTADMQTNWQLWKYSQLGEKSEPASLLDFNDLSVYLGSNLQQWSPPDSPDIWLTGRISFSVTLQPPSWAVLAAGNELQDRLEVLIANWLKQDFCYEKVSGWSRQGNQDNEVYF